MISIQRGFLFIHIPKTGGSMIEKFMADRGISWGICKFTSTRASLTSSRGEIECPGTSPFRYPYADVVPKGCTLWHLPSYMFDKATEERSRNLHPYQGATLFVVVRDPLLWCAVSRCRAGGARFVRERRVTDRGAPWLWFARNLE